MSLLSAKDEKTFWPKKRVAGLERRKGAGQGGGARGPSDVMLVSNHIPHPQVTAILLS